MTVNWRDRLDYGEQFEGMPTIIASRNTTRTTFAVLHEPYRNTYRLRSFHRIAETGDAIAVSVRGEGVDDRLMMRWGPAANESLLLRDDVESFQFAGQAFVRITPDRIIVEGGLEAMIVRVGDSKPALIVNGRPEKAEVRNGFSAYRMPVPSLAISSPAAPLTEPGAVWTAWHPHTLRLPTAGSGGTSLIVRNGRMHPLDVVVPLHTDEGLAVEPRSITLTGLAPGAETNIIVTVTADQDFANRFLTVRCDHAGDALPVQPAVLRVANGVVREDIQLWPRQFARQIYAPRYVARYDYLDSTAAV